MSCAKVITDDNCVKLDAEREWLGYAAINYASQMGFRCTVVSIDESKLNLLAVIDRPRDDGLYRGLPYHQRDGSYLYL